MVNHGSNSDSPEAASEGVGDEGADQRRQAGGAGEIGESVCRFGEWQMKLCRQVAYHISMESHHCQLLTNLICYIYMTK